MCWHKWKKWEIKEDSRLRVNGLDQGTIIIQQKICSKCGKIKIRVEKEWI